MRKDLKDYASRQMQRESTVALWALLIGLAVLAIAVFMWMRPASAQDVTPKNARPAPAAPAPAPCMDLAASRARAAAIAASGEHKGELTNLDGDKARKFLESIMETAPPNSWTSPKAIAVFIVEDNGFALLILADNPCGGFGTALKMPVPLARKGLTAVNGISG